MKRAIVFLLALLLAAAGLCTAACAEDAEAIVDPFRLYSYEQLMADLDALAQRYPELVSVDVIGQSVEGRDIPVLCVGKGSRNVILCAAMHAREYETTNVLVYTLERYCRAYEADEWYCGLSYRKLLDGVRFVAVPMLNPDGVVIAQQGTAWALENEKLAAMPITDGWPGNYYCWKANANGVDLNRNWSYGFNNAWKSRVPSSADYAGPEPMSEPETQAMAALLERTPYYAFCSFHSAGDCIYWIDNGNSQALRDKLFPVAGRIAEFCGYRLILNEDISCGAGYMINQARAATEKPCITVELGPYAGRYPFSDYEGLRAIAEKAYPIGLLLADEVLRMPEDPAPEPAPEPEPEAEPEPPEVRVTLDGAEIVFPDAHPVIEDRRTLTPVRAVCEAAGLTVSWEQGTVTLTDGTRTAEMRIGEPVLTVDGGETALDCAPVLRGGRTLVPIRAIMEAFGYSVDWDGENRIVCVTSPARE